MLISGLVALSRGEASAQSQDRDTRFILAGLHEPSFSMKPHQNELRVKYSRAPLFTVPAAIDYPADAFAFRSATRRLDIDGLVLAGAGAHMLTEHILISDIADRATLLTHLIATAAR